MGFTQNSCSFIYKMSDKKSQVQSSNDFDANLGGLSINDILPDTKPKGKKECVKGPECPHFLKGKCNFYHPKSAKADDEDDDNYSVASGDLDEKPKHRGKPAAKVSLNSRVSVEPAKKPPCKDGPTCKFLARGECKFYHPKPKPAGEKDFTPRVPCRDGDNCKKLAQGKCTFLHEPVSAAASVKSSKSKEPPKSKATLLLSLSPEERKQFYAMSPDEQKLFLEALL